MASECVYDIIAVGNLFQAVPNVNKSCDWGLASEAACCSLVAAYQNMRTGIVGKIRPEAEGNLYNDLKKAGVNTAGIIQGSASPITVNNIPKEYYQCQLIYICPESNEVPKETLDQITRLGKKNAVALRGYCKRYGSLSSVELEKTATEISGYFEIVRVSDADCRLIFGDEKLEYCAGKLLEAGPEIVIVTTENEGIIVCTPATNWRTRPIENQDFYSNEVFMVTFLCEYIRNNDCLQSIISGCAASSCFSKKPGKSLLDKIPSEPEIRDYVARETEERILEF